MCALGLLQPIWVFSPLAGCQPSCLMANYLAPSKQHILIPKERSTYGTRARLGSMVIYSHILSNILSQASNDSLPWNAIARGVGAIYPCRLMLESPHPAWRCISDTATVRVCKTRLELSWIQVYRGLSPTSWLSVLSLAPAPWTRLPVLHPNFCAESLLPVLQCHALKSQSVWLGE